MRGKEGAFIAAQAIVTCAVLLLISLPAMDYKTVSSSQQSTSVASESAATTTAPCNAPGTYCGPGFAISNASLVSASTLGRSYSLLTFNVNGTYGGLKITSMTVWLANATFSQTSYPNGGDAHLVGKVYPSWSGKDGSLYTFDVPTTGFHAAKGALCELWIDAYSVFPSPLKGDNWALQNMTIG